MKVKAIRRFRDKYTNEIHDRDDVFEVSQERYEEIVKVGGNFGGLVTPVDEPKKAAQKVTKKAANKKQ